MVDYVGIRARADKMVKKYGRAMTLKKQASSVYDPATSTNTLTETSYTVYGVAFDYDILTTGKRNEKGNLVEVGDKHAYVSAKDLAVVPEVNDTLVIGSEIWKIIRIPMDLNPGGTTVLYELALGK